MRSHGEGPGASQMPGAEGRCWWRASPWTRAEDKALKKGWLQTPHASALEARPGPDLWRAATGHEVKFCLAARCPFMQGTGDTFPSEVGQAMASESQ
ncbi:putative uncharacterized protein BRD3OS isoform X1 [Suricata suricatta]|uniref:putative uncharacterized protein BRD3OS isoform X1 n=1 Tax=Suricata suricatta TaxID=37032 RepID=UPI0011558600|nr:putative uncharacterized protein BRD3OS isoform X1 [Suricata suricatta]